MKRWPSSKRIRTSSGVVASLALSLFGCSTMPVEQGNPNPCYNVNVCEVLPLDVVDGAIGGPFEFPVASSMPDDGSGEYVDYCHYSKTGTPGMTVTRTCYFDETEATYQYNQVRGWKLSPPSTGHEVAGVGDHAFIVNERATNSSDYDSALYAVKGTVSLVAEDPAVPAAADIESGLDTLANLVFEH